MDDAKARIGAALEHRFGAPVAPLGDPDGPQPWPQTWQDLATRGCCRAFTDRKVAPELIETLCALALSSPSKSDLQQRDIIIVEDRQIRQAIDHLLATEASPRPGSPAPRRSWSSAPTTAGNASCMPGVVKPFANDHLDVFFNAALDAGIALSAFVIAAEAAGLGCAPISAIRNHAQEVSDLLGLPEHVFPIAGLGLGWPSRAARISLRLPLARPSIVTASMKPASRRPSRPTIVAATPPSPSSAQRSVAKVRRGGILRLVGRQGAPVCYP